MGKKRIIKEKSGETSSELRARSLSHVPKKKLSSAIVFIEATYNNTKISLADKEGNVLIWSSAGSLGFKGTKKSTPFAASKVSEIIAEKAKSIGVKEIDVQIKGVGGGRESSLRALAAQGLEINSIKDATPIPHNGPRPKKARRV